MVSMAHSNENIMNSNILCSPFKHRNGICTFQGIADMKCQDLLNLNNEKFPLSVGLECLNKEKNLILT